MDGLLSRSDLAQRKNRLRTYMRKMASTVQKYGKTKR